MFRSDIDFFFLPVWRIHKAVLWLICSKVIIEKSRLIILGTVWLTWTMAGGQDLAQTKDDQK